MINTSSARRRVRRRKLASRKEGENAARAGLLSSTNPYPVTNPLHSIWREGYLCAVIGDKTL